MAQETPGNTDGRSVGDMATVRRKLNLNRTTLLGTFGDESALSALLRLPSGEVLRIAQGDEVWGGTIAAIGPGEVIIAQGSKTQTYRLP